MPNNGKKTIMIIADDIRMSSGVGTMAKELVLGIAHHYNIVQLGGAVVHPEVGKVADLSQATDQMLGITGSYVKIYPVNGYGDENVLYNVMAIENPDAILAFTDPRFFGFLFALERDIRRNIPLTYIALWDCPPYPMWNRGQAYLNCDLIMAISKQSDNIHLNVAGPEN
jgi:hypothetical protein